MLNPVLTLAPDPLYVGVDIGKATSFAGFLSTDLLRQHDRYEQCPTLKFEQSRTGFQTLLDTIKLYAPLDQVSVLIERTGHYHIALRQFLTERGVTVYEVHVLSRPNRDKTDRLDSLGLALHLYNQEEKHVQHPESIQRARRFHPASATATQLLGLVKQHDELTRDMTRRRNKLTSLCDEIFPELTLILADPNGPSALALREKYPTPNDIAAAPLADLIATRTYRRPSDAALARLQELARSTIGTKDAARLQSIRMEQKHLIAELKLFREHLAAIDAEITAIIEESREGKILLSMPSIGPIQAASILASIGTITNFPSAAHLRKFFGWSPVQSQTGTTFDSSKLTRGGNHTLKRALFLMACNAIRTDTEWREIYNRLLPVKCIYDARTKTYKGKMKVVGRIAGQMVSMIYAFLKHDYDVLAALAPGEEAPDPILYDRTIHKAHRTGAYRSLVSSGKIGESTEVVRHENQA